MSTRGTDGKKALIDQIVALGGRSFRPKEYLDQLQRMSTKATAAGAGGCGNGAMERGGVSAQNDKDLELTQQLYDFLQGKVPDGFKISRNRVPKLTPEQAWTVVWYLGNQYWQVTDRVEKCDVCGYLFHTWQEGACLDFGKSPYYFCDSCTETEEYAKKSRSRLNPENKNVSPYDR